MAQPQHQFPIDDPPTFPQRSPSGGLIKTTVIRAMAEIYTANKLAHGALDRLIEVCRTMPPSHRQHAAK
jgi:hypothetical protein